MPRRRKKQNKLVLILSIIFSVSVLLIFLGYIQKYKFLNKTNTFKQSSSKIDSNTSTGILSNDDFYIGKEIRFVEGKLEYKPVYGYYFFQLKDSINGKNFGLRSDKYVLSNYSGDRVKVKGKIVDFYGDTPIIYVDQLISENKNISGNINSGDKKEQLNINKFLKYGLILDFNSLSGWKAELENNKIFVYHSGDKVIEIEPFVCNSKLNLYNCKKIYNDFTNLNFESFISSNGLKYFHIPESDTRFTTNNFLWGYYITPENDNILFKISSYIIPYDIDKFKNSLVSIVEDICKNNSSQIKSIKGFDIISSGNSFKGIITGKDNNDNEIVCNILINFEGNVPVVNLEKYELLKRNKNNNLDNKNNNKILISTGDYLTTNFSHGFNVRIPSKNVIYKQIFKKTDLGIQNLECDYRVYISNWKNRANIDTDPDIIVYRCKGSYSKEDLKKLLKDLLLLESNDNYYYIVKYKQQYEDIAKNLKIIE